MKLEESLGLMNKLSSLIHFFYLAYLQAQGAGFYPSEDHSLTYSQLPLAPQNRPSFCSVQSIKPRPHSIVLSFSSSVSLKYHNEPLYTLIVGISVRSDLTKLRFRFLSYVQ